MNIKIANGNHVLKSRLILALVLVLFPAADPMAGAYIFADEINGVNIVTHPTGYTGSAGTGALTVRVCIDPSSPNATAMEIPVQNNINIYNRLQPTTPNLFSVGNNNVPSGQIDLESVSLHEIGHCLGMAHANAASESGLPGSAQNYTRATDGANNSFDTAIGPDGIIGSSDDIRGDDVNLHWFRTSNNNPFTIDDPVDSTTYARDTSSLPSGHTFAANADRVVGNLLGFPDTEAVMQQGTYYDEAQRTLAHDDVATLLYAASGVNEKVGGFPDNYTINLEYGGISTGNCDISLRITNTSSLAFCNVGGTGIGGFGSNHVSITSASIEFGSAFAWYFNTETVNNAPVLAPIGGQTTGEGQPLSVGISATDDDADTLQYNTTGLPAFVTFTNTGNGAATLDIEPAAGDAGTYPVTIDVTDNGLPALSDNESFNIIVKPPNQPPVLAAIGDQTVTAGESLSVAISATNPDGDIQLFTAAGLPAFATLTDHGNDTATLDINPSPTDAGTTTVTIDVTDDGIPALSDSEIFNIIVDPATDSDGDGLSDSYETIILFTNPNSVDTDGDGLADGAGGVVPLAALPGGIDADGDGFVDGEQDLGTNPVLEDTDGDQLADGLEVAYNADPLDPASWPNLADGDIAPLGQPDGFLNAGDYYLMQRIVLQQITPTPLEFAHGDLYPAGSPDNVIDTSDLILLLEMVMSAP